MVPTAKWLMTAAVIAPAAVWASQTRVAVETPAAAVVAVDQDDIGGVVRSKASPEAGVWVIAETTALSTPFRKIVVTDDQGRFLLPDLPAATYRIWVRGYGLVDSEAITATPGKTVALTAVPAPSPQEAAKIFPPNYWYSLLQPPPKSEFPGTGPEGNGISPNMKTQAHWIDVTKQGCQLCHQMGSLVTRGLPDRIRQFDSTVAAWDRLVQSGQRGPQMSNVMTRFGRSRGLAMYADWTDRILGGEVPPTPPRPAGVERNVVLTMWEWSKPANYLHDEVSTDKRHPTVNANGPVYGVSITHDTLVIANPRTNSSEEFRLGVLDPATPPFFPQRTTVPSQYFGTEVVYTGYANPHNPMMDRQGRVWITQSVRPAAKPASFCTDGSTPFSKYYPVGRGRNLANFDPDRSGRQLSVYDPSSAKLTLIDTCYGTHHLQFDDNDTLWTSGGGEVIGWFDTKVFDKTGDAQAAQGWCPTILDYNGDGRIGPYTEPNEKPDPTKDRRISGGGYGIITSPVDESVWVAEPGPFPGAIVRLERGSAPPLTCKAEMYEPPLYTPSKHGFAPRGIDIDRNGVIWTALSGSGHMASFDRRKCKVTNGPSANGQHCPEGWTLYTQPGPQMKGVTDSGSADFSYYNWVDQFNTFGLGENVPIANGSGSDSLLALKPDGTWVVLRVPYPMGFFSRGVDGRIDDPTGGWKGRGLWANFGSNTLWHGEDKKDARSNIVHFQLRPDPLAK